MNQAVLAHQGGWDEILLVVGPLAVVGFLLWVANKRIAAQLDHGSTNAETTSGGAIRNGGASTGVASTGGGSNGGAIETDGDSTGGASTGGADGGNEAPTAEPG